LQKANKQAGAASPHFEYEKLHDAYFNLLMGLVVKALPGSTPYGCGVCLNHILQVL
jgi:hypothetical protein